MEVKSWGARRRIKLSCVRGTSRVGGAAGRWHKVEQRTHKLSSATAQPPVHVRPAGEFPRRRSLLLRATIGEILLGLIDARDILECDPAMRLGQKLCARLPEAERLAAGALHLRDRKILTPIMAKIGSHDISKEMNHGTSFCCGRAVISTFFE